MGETMLHEECPDCGWEGTVLIERGKALCPECEWFFSLPDHRWDLQEI